MQLDGVAISADVCGMVTLRHHVEFALALLATAAPARAQDTGKLAEGTRDSLRVTWADLTSRCVTPVVNPYVTPVRRSDCRVASVTPLGSGDGRDWHVVRYLRELIVQDTAWADTMPLDELVLAGRAPGAADAEVVLHWTSDRRALFLDTAVAVPTAQGLLMELTVCLNGTGGCAREYLRLAAGRWREVIQAYVTDLHARLPADHTLHKGRQLDLATLRGVWPVAAPGDPNCCPSFEIAFRVRLDGDTLRLVEAGPMRRAPEQ
jgi:hypothetical protein